MGCEGEIRQLFGKLLVFETVAYKGAALHDFIRWRGNEFAQGSAQIEGLQEAGVGTGANDESGRNREAVTQQFAEVGTLASNPARVADAYVV